MKQRQSGVALLAAMLTVTLVATFAAAALWHQWRSVEIESAERTRVQSAWILTGALDWARLILREDGRSNAVDHLGEPWAVPLQEARLSTFLAADAGSAESDSDNTFLSGQITDLQGLLDIGLIARGGQRLEPGIESFRRLFELLGLPRPQLDRMIENLRFATDINGDNLSASKAPLAPRRVEELVWLGLSPDTVQALKPYVTVLPPSTLSANVRGVNINTASAEVIYAIGQGFGLAEAQRLVAYRDSQHFKTESEALQQLPTAVSKFQPGLAKVSSSFFEVKGRLRIGDTVVEETSIVQRSGSDVRTLQRERAGIVVPTQATGPR
jgi:general secretion pathway protein K